MKSFADWTQEIAEGNNMEPEPDITDQAADGLGYLTAVWQTCPHCGYDFHISDYAKHVESTHMPFTTLGH